MQARSLFISLASAIILSACASNAPNPNFMDADGYTVKVATAGSLQNPMIREVVWQKQFKNVLIVVKEDGAPANDHPAAVSADDLERILKSLKLVNPSDKKSSLFKAEEIEELTPHLAKALATAKADQDVVFYYPPQYASGFFEEAMMTSARVFVEGGKLNLIFGTLVQPYEGQWQQAKVLRLYPTGSRAKNTLNGFAMLANHNAGVYVDAGRRDWVKIDLSQAAAPTPGMKTTQPVAAPVRTSQERLQKLEELKQKGLIDEDEYRAKRKQILDSL